MHTPQSMSAASRAFTARAERAFARIVATSPALRNPEREIPCEELDLETALAYARTIELGGSALIWECEGTDEVTKA
jgi:hypothetical protein